MQKSTNELGQNVDYARGSTDCIFGREIYKPNNLNKIK